MEILFIYIIHILLISLVGYLLVKSVNKQATLWQKILCYIFLFITPISLWKKRKK
jgi:predicted permease